MKRSIVAAMMVFMAASLIVKADSERPAAASVRIRLPERFRVLTDQLFEHPRPAFALPGKTVERSDKAFR